VAYSGGSEPFELLDAVDERMFIEFSWLAISTRKVCRSRLSTTGGDKGITVESVICGDRGAMALGDMGAWAAAF
jgi:hypothetical protein